MKKQAAALLSLLFFPFSLFADALQPTMLPSTESDPDSFIEDCVNVINGDYCEASTDLEIKGGPDIFLLQRYANANNYITGEDCGGWRILPQRFLVLGKDPEKKRCTKGQERLEWTYAFCGERSGGILTYSGWRSPQGTTEEPLTINIFRDGLGMANTYAKEINGQVNQQNHALHCRGDTCEITLGDGTRRLYERVSALPSLLLGEELVPFMAKRVAQPEYFHLIRETLPSGNYLLFSYDNDGHLSTIEIKSGETEKILAWMSFSYVFENGGCFVKVVTSDEKSLEYQLEKRLFANGNTAYALSEVRGFHLIPCRYDYQVKDQNLLLTRKALPEGRFTGVEYDEKGRVCALKAPHHDSGKPETLYSFHYGEGYTDVFNAAGIKTRYRFDQRLQLTAVEKYDEKGDVFRVERRFWGQTEQDAGLLLAKTIADGNGHIYSYRSLTYDKNRNVVEERLYGNLTGKEDAFLPVNENGELLNPEAEYCHKTFIYSEDGFNLLVRMGDCKGNQTIYRYQPGTNLLTKKLLYYKRDIQKRTFRFYNEDAVCIKVIEDDGEREEEPIQRWEVSERHITEITPNGVGLPEVIEMKAANWREKKGILISRLVNHFDARVLSVSVRDFFSE